MQFNKNKDAYIHKWYPFVEGYSKDFINSIVDEINYKPTCALDPFAGSGTTPLELQHIGVKCHSFEVSPFMHLLATTKLETNYKLNIFEGYLKFLNDFLNENLRPIRSLMKPPLAKTFQPRKGKDKWVYDVQAMSGILDIKLAIREINNPLYEKLFNIALASILLDVSNVYRNGKCLSYKKKWEEIKLSRRDIHHKFLFQLKNVIQPDIAILEKSKKYVLNIEKCHYGDVRSSMSIIEDNSIDLVITSPPYLNSRDYTDIYLTELWNLDLIKNYHELKQLRKNTFISHVQISHGEIECLPIPELLSALSKLELSKDSFWNSNIPSMIKGYFKDMDNLFFNLKQKMIVGKKIYFNVANSAYYGIEIKVDEIVCKIAETNGFTIDEIREARRLNPSGQQKEQIKYLRESVIVMTS